VSKFYRLAGVVTVMLITIVVCSCGGKSEDADTKEAAFPDSIVDDEVIVLVNSHPITGRDMRVFTLVYRSGTPDSLRQRSFNEKMLDGMIDRTLLWLEAEALGVTVNDSTQQWYLREFTAASGGDAAVDAFLESVGFTKGDLTHMIRKDLQIRLFLETNVAQNTTAPDSVVRAYYDQNSNQFWTPDSVRARHIILRASQSDTPESTENKKQTLRDIRARVIAGEDFGEMAKQFSEGPSASNGGDLGYFTQRDMVAPFTNAAFSLEPGQVSHVVQTRFGYHLIQAVDRKASRKLTFEEVEPGLNLQISQYMAAQALQNHLQRSRAVAIIEKNY
jgi:peptidyl-prolyl cis-trans isomerase C